PLPVWSGNRTRHRLSRTGNRQLNCALHRIAVTQKRCHPPAQAYLARRTAAGSTPTEALRALKRRLSDTIYPALLADSTPPSPPRQLDIGARYGDASCSGSDQRPGQLRNRTVLGGGPWVEGHRRQTR